MSNPVNIKTNSLLEALYAQASNPIYPNILPNKFSSLQRLLQTYVDQTYGVNDTKVAGVGGNTIKRYLVLSVQGQYDAPNTPKGDKVRNIIFIANQAFNPAIGTSFVLRTPENDRVNVTLKSILGKGAFEVNEDLIEDIDNLPDNFISGNYPYLEWNGNAPPGNGAATGGVK